MTVTSTSATKRQIFRGNTVLKIIALCIPLVGCGVSMRDFTEPGWKAEQDEREAKEELARLQAEKAAQETVENSVYLFDINSQYSACKRAADYARVAEVSLSECTLNDGLLTVSISSEGESLSQTYDLTKVVLNLESDLLDTKEDFQFFFFTMRESVAVSTRRAHQTK